MRNVSLRLPEVTQGARVGKAIFGICSTGAVLKISCLPGKDPAAEYTSSRGDIYKGVIHQDALGIGDTPQVSYGNDVKRMKEKPVSPIIAIVSKDVKIVQYEK